MSDRLFKQINVEIEQLTILVEKFKPLVAKCSLHEPDVFEVVALGSMLHSFYTGVENVFNRVRKEFLGDVQKSDRWHKDLLDYMAQPSQQLPAILSMELRNRLSGYLDFRHMFRQAYHVDLSWDKMKKLVFGCEETLHMLENELRIFMEKLRSPNPE